MAVVQMVGQYRLQQLDYNDNSLDTLMQKHAYEFTVGTTPPSDRSIEPSVNMLTSPILREDDKFAVYMNLSTQITENASTNSNFLWQIPITFKNLRTGDKYRQTLCYTDFNTTGCQVPSNSQVWKAGVWYKLGYWQVPAQSAIKFGQDIQDVRIDSKIILFQTLTT